MNPEDVSAIGSISAGVIALLALIVSIVALRYSRTAAKATVESAQTAERSLELGYERADLADTPSFRARLIGPYNRMRDVIVEVKRDGGGPQKIDVSVAFHATAYRAGSSLMNSNVSDQPIRTLDIQVSEGMRLVSTPIVSILCFSEAVESLEVFLVITAREDAGPGGRARSWELVDRCEWDHPELQEK